MPTGRVDCAVDCVACVDRARRRSRACSWLAACIALALVGCAAGGQASCPDLAGTYRDAGGPLRLSVLLGLKGSPTVALAHAGDELLASTPGEHRTLRLGTDFRCENGRLRLLRPMTEGAEISGIGAQYMDRYFMLSRRADGVLVADTSERTRIRFLLPELTAAAVAGPTYRWERVSR